MARSLDRKEYWDLFETLRWIQTCDEQAVAELCDWRDEDRMAVTLVAMKVPRVLPPRSGCLEENRDPEAMPPEPPGDSVTTISALDGIIRESTERSRSDDRNQMRRSQQTNDGPVG